MDIKIKAETKCDNVINFIAEAARICYDRHEIERPGADNVKFVIGLFEKKHYSPFEFVDYDVLISGSRVLLAQITRHWNSIFMVKSGRYVKETAEKIRFYIPEPIEKLGDAVIVHESTTGAPITIADYLKLSTDFYYALTGDQFKINTEDARYFLPQALVTNIRFKFSLKDLLVSIYPQRSSSKAQAEIRAVIQGIFNEVMINGSRELYDFLTWYKNIGIKKVER